MQTKTATTTIANPKPDLSKHPCFNEEVRCSSARIHLPVAPRCNVQCNFCNRDFSCANESRPGVTSKVLGPKDAVKSLRETMAKVPNINVVGIAGPGDPFANPVETMETLRLVRQEFPGMVLCVATNGLNLMPHVDELAELQVSHVTITINAVDPMIGKDIYLWMRYGKGTRNGLEAAEHLLVCQLAAIKALKEKGILVKVNTIAIPGHNMDHIPAIAKTVSELGADVLNIIPLMPVAGTGFANIKAPEKAAIDALRAEVSPLISQMAHCSRCRADAVGLLGQDTTIEQIRALQATKAEPAAPSPAPAASAKAPDSSTKGSKVPETPAKTLKVAVATMEGMLVNQHLGEAVRLMVYRTGPDGSQILGQRETPPPGNGASRWEALADQFADCDYLVVNGVGPTPQKTIEAKGLKILVVEGLIQETLDTLGKGESMDRLVKQAAFSCGSSCSGTGGGCG